MCPWMGNFSMTPPPSNTELQLDFWERLETPQKGLFWAPNSQLCTISSSCPHRYSSTRQNLGWAWEAGFVFLIIRDSPYRRCSILSFSIYKLLRLEKNFLGAVCLPTSLRQFWGFSGWWVYKCLVHKCISLRIVVMCACVSRSVVCDSLRPVDCSVPSCSVRGLLLAEA